ncbi:glycosyltransferase family 2 protein [Photobacterium damselae subsp. damselae]|uniref:Glycosyltransferase family 2 protein n=1 Tax=Photobacterium damselae subsp. damselae TaxID=85581 RepID=A0A850QXN8_PHODD|nr:glycosyltransferase family 2 protein [Photobacterium damselae subsp. damselae]
MFSIIIPTYNRKKSLLSTLDNLELQTKVNFEVIIVDDFSTDGTDSAINFSKYNFNIKYIKNTMNLGAAKSRNIGCQNASFDWLLFLDDDDIFHKDKTLLIEEAILNNKFDFCYHKATINMVNENVSYITKPYLPIHVSMDNMFEKNQIGGTPMWCVSKLLFLKLGGFSEDILALEDYEFLLKMLSNKKDVNVHYIDHALTNCFYTTKKVSVSKNISHTKDAIRYIENKYNLDKNKKFKCNQNEILAHSLLMSLNRSSFFYYVNAFKETLKISYLFKSISVLISPQLTIILRRFI